MEGLGQLLSTFQIVKEDLNQDLDIEGVLLTMFDPRNKLTHEVVKEMKSHFPEKLYETVIPRNVKLSESPSFGKPVILYDPESKGSHAYQQLAVEFLRRNGFGPKVLAEDNQAEPISAVIEPTSENQAADALRQNASAEVVIETVQAVEAQESVAPVATNLEVQTEISQVSE